MCVSGVCVCVRGVRACECARACARAYACVRVCVFYHTISLCACVLCQHVHVLSCAVHECECVNNLLYSTPLHSTLLHSTPLHSTLLFYTPLYCTLPYSLYSCQHSHSHTPFFLIESWVAQVYLISVCIQVQLLIMLLNIVGVCGGM